MAVKEHGVLIDFVFSDWCWCEFFLIKCRWPLQMHHRHSKRCPRSCIEIPRTRFSLRYTPKWGYLGFGIARTWVTCSLVLPGTCWQSRYGTVTPFWVILGLLCWWMLLGLVHNTIVLCMIPLFNSIISSSLYFTPCHRRRCSSTPPMLN